MTKRSLVWLMACLSVFIWSTTSEALETKMIVIKQQDNGKHFTIKVGTLIQVELAQPGTTGFLWQVEALNEALLNLVQTGSKRGDEKAATRAPVTGAGVTKYWLLKAKQKGKTELELLLYRPWEGKDTFEDRFAVELTIE